MFNIMCEVYGGVTGHRTALLKNDGKVVEFATREEADAKARELSRAANNEHAVAVFRYWSVEVA